MLIINNTGIQVKWACFNSDDIDFKEPLGQGYIRNGGKTSYDPPSNATKRYCLRIMKAEQYTEGKLLYSGGIEAWGTIALKTLPAGV